MSDELPATQYSVALGRDYTIPGAPADVASLPPYPDPLVCPSCGETWINKANVAPWENYAMFACQRVPACGLIWQTRRKS